MKWGSRAGYNWDEVKDVKVNILPLITKELVTSYLLETKIGLSEIINNMTDDIFHLKDEFHWFDSIFEKLIYILRHTMHHIGELFLALRKWDCERGKWE